MIQIASVLTLWIFLVLYCSVRVGNCQTITIPNLGTLIGTTTEGAWTSKPIYQFLGIKYAEPPSGSMRFKAPVLAKPQSGIQNVQKYGRSCPSMENIKKKASDEEDIEDCLNISIHTGNFTASHPVIVYIHGGGFTQADASHSPPNYLLERDVVLAVPHYRLGPLGFISTETDDIPGNAALLDVILALEWIQTYISYFGGDPKKITLYGLSASASMVSALLLSPSVPSHIFHRVILASGSAVSAWSLDLNPIEHARDIAKFSGCSNYSTPLELNHCLMNVDAASLIFGYQMHMITNAIKGVNHYGGARLTFGGSKHNILPMSPYDLIKTAARKNISVMVGATKQDGSMNVALFYLGTAHIIDFNNRTFNSHHLIDKITDFFGLEDYTGTLTGYLTSKLYTHEQIVNGNFTDMIDGLIDIASVTSFKAPALRIVQAQAKVYPEQTYLYSFDYTGEFAGYNFELEIDGFDIGVHHSHDKIFIFPYPPRVAHLNAADTIISKQLINLWTSFAATGVPLSEGIPNWPPVTKISGPFLHINDVSTIGDDYLEEYSVTVRERRGKA